MEKNNMKSGSLVELEMLTESSISTHWHGFIELLYVITGTAQVTIAENTWSLKAQDIIVVNANRHHSYRGSADLLLGRFLISESRLQELMSQKTIVLWCNSAAEQHEAFGELRAVLNRILNDSLNEEKSSNIYRESLYYRLLHILCSQFLIPQDNLRIESGGTSDEERLQDIFTYIRSNCRQNIRLKDLADTLYLSETYVSRYIKKKCGIGFVELVNMVRLEQSMEDLMETNTPIIRIAMDNGFASVAAYNRTFRERYQVSPTQYRRTIQEQRRQRSLSPEQRIQEERIRHSLENFLTDNLFAQEEGPSSEKEVHVDGNGTLQPLCKDGLLAVINVGTLHDLLKYDLQQQILASKDRLGFRYVRFWEPFGEEMHIDPCVPADQLNFGQVDMALDFLVRNGLRPYFELGHKPKRILKNTGEAVYDESPQRMEFESEEQMREFHRRLIRHLMRRYGAPEVSGWYWEIHEQEELRISVDSFDYAPLPDEAHQVYLRRFDVIAGVLRENLPDVKVGGGGFPPQHYGESGMRHIADLWGEGHLLPDFFTVTSFPYQLRKEGRVWSESRSTDADYLLHNIQLVQRALRGSVLEGRAIHVTEYGITLSSRNVINDSCSKASWLAGDLIGMQSAGNVVLGHWLFSDLYADYDDSARLLFGGAGLVCREGIPKPAWYAFDFFRGLYEQVIYRDRNVLVTTDGGHAFRILCHNRKVLTFRYYAAKEDRITAEELPQMLEDRLVLRLHFRFDNLPDGEYLIRRRRVNGYYGNVQTQWKEMGQEEELSLEELEHLKTVTGYHLTMHRETASGGSVSFTVPLEADEISWIQISPR